MDWMQVLVIILAVFLALFLLLSIILITVLIKVTKQIKSITSSAERTVMKFEHTAANIAAYSSPANIVKMVTSIIKKRSKKG